MQGKWDTSCCYQQKYHNYNIANSFDHIITGIYKIIGHQDKKNHKQRSAD